MSCDSSCEQIILGSTCDSQINYGETIDIIFTYTDDAGVPIDLSSSEVAIFSSTPSVIKEKAEISIFDAISGKIRMLLHREDSLNLRKGLSNRFRVQVIFGPESDDVTPDIWIQVT